MVKIQKNFRLEDEDLELLNRMKAELVDSGLNVSDSDIVALALKELSKQGGPIGALQKGAKHGTRRKREIA